MGSDDTSDFSDVVGSINPFAVALVADADSDWQRLGERWAPQMVGRSGAELIENWLEAVAGTFSDRCAIGELTVLEAQSIARLGPTVHYWVATQQLSSERTDSACRCAATDALEWPLHPNWVSAVLAEATDTRAMGRASEIVATILDDRFVRVVNDVDGLVAELHALGTAIRAARPGDAR